ncbi:MAG: tyrosine--tRNA ligase [Rhodospirillaceae bacterium]|nr:tyrosine--tRNA ligase [Rhodospirillaceae bacterium]
MAAFKSELVRTLNDRGYIFQCTALDELDARAAAGTLTGYIGFDATADSLHVGHLMQIMMLRWMQRTGHRPIALMGGGTTKIGDPSFKDETRKLLDEDTIRANIASIRKTFEHFFDFGGGPTDAILADNAEWLDKLLYIPFLREVGRHFTINRMLTMDSVKLRLEREQPLTFLEFNYMILQAFDFAELYKRHGCVLQLGGADQWGNIVQGVDLGRRIADAELFGLTSPLITTASGAKMGKTVAGAVWLSAHRLAPYDYFQFWRNTEDADVGRFLKLFTDLPLDEIARYEALQGAEINEGKKKLAFEATALLHGAQAAAEAAETARRTFEEGGAGESLPTITMTGATVKAGYSIVEANIGLGFATSKSDARRAIQEGSVRLNDAKVDDEAATITLADFKDGVAKLSRGKKRHGLIKLTD